MGDMSKNIEYSYREYVPRWYTIYAKELLCTVYVLQFSEGQLI